MWLLSVREFQRVRGAAANETDKNSKTLTKGIVRQYIGKTSATKKNKEMESRLLRGSLLNRVGRKGLAKNDI